jgi:hypothetical protein
MEYFECAKRYYHEHGHLLIFKHEHYEGKDLGRWVSNQRHYYNSKQQSIATQKVELLNTIGMIWNMNDSSWELGFSYAQKYYQEHGNLDIKADYVVDGYNLGHWILNQRSKHTGRYATSCRLSEHQIERLSEIGMIWNALDYRWERMYDLAKEYYEATGSLLVPYEYCIDNNKLGRWILQQRKNYRTGTNPNFTKERIKRLEDIGMVWEIGKGQIRPKKLDQNWLTMFNILKDELEKKPDIVITKRYETDAGVKIGSWLNRQKRLFEGKVDGVLLDWQIEMLRSIKVF